MKTCKRCKEGIPAGRVRCICASGGRRRALLLDEDAEPAPAPEPPKKRGAQFAPRPDGIEGKMDLYAWRAEQGLPLFEE